MSRKNESLTGNFDWLTLAIYFVLVLVGWLAIYSSVYSEEHSNIFDTSRNSGKQFQWMLASFAIAFLIMIIDGKFFSTFAYPIYIISMLFCASVIFFGVKIKGQQNWLPLGPIQVQPSEFAKFATSLAVAKYLSGLNVDIRKWKHKLFTLLFIAIPAAIISIHGDAGSAIVFLSLLLALYREGLESYYLIFGSTFVLLSLLALLIDKYVLVISLL
ncbi:MAG: rod shape-determining protein RodA, partial [Chitinophagales bacterium]|nr:rod shape-determining protein RodA [Chitinophagales bacterium]